MAALRFTPSKLDEAKAWLREALADGKTGNAGELQDAAEKAGIKRRTLQLAAKDVAEVKPVYGNQGIIAWQWKLK